jgi:tRNA (adenine37-N6)-methyltransferase
MEQVMSNHDVRLSPVGSVRVGEEGFALEIEPRFRPALHGLEGFSHVDVLWWSHLLDEPQYRGILQCESPYRSAPSSLGVFATRSPRRPNPICLSVAQVIRLDEEQGVLWVTYIDAEEGTPILDIKPYHPCSDRVREVSVPAWCQKWPQWYEDSASFDWEKVFITAR